MSFFDMTTLKNDVPRINTDIFFPRMAPMMDHSEAADIIERHSQDLLATYPHKASACPVRVDFFPNIQPFWHCLAPLIEECRSRDSFSPRVILHTSGEREFFMAGEAAWLEKIGVPWISEDNYAPDMSTTDVLCLTKPYMDKDSKHLHPHALIEKGVRVALVPYCTEWLGGEYFGHYYFRESPVFWRTFVASSLSQHQYVQRLNLPQQMVPIIGNPEYDVAPALKAAPKCQEILQQAAGRRILLWTPHYSCGVKTYRWGTWDGLGHGMARIFSRYADKLLVVLRPHQGMRAKLFQNTIDEAVRQMPNVVIDLTGQALESLMACDALVSDCSSLLAKAMRLGKSVLYTYREDGDGAAHIDSLLRGRVHISADLRGVQQFVEMLLCREDPLLPLPEALKNHLCGPMDANTARRFADHLEHYFFAHKGAV